MDRLILLRHGDAERHSASGEDFDRQLTSTGRRESLEAGENLAHLGFMPDVALVSGAARARETWAAAAPALPCPEVRYDDRLYLAEAPVIREAADAVGEQARTVMVVGHNPGLQELIVMLLIEGAAAPQLIARAKAGFPTGAAAVFLIDANGRPAFDGLLMPGGRRH
ncbi:MAG: histidine phosphatase family protein [Phenylobacterium sp.]|nr:histidine phosphatase family protein [Phenylobacterium sp.]